MSFLFGKSKKTPPDLIRSLLTHVQTLVEVEDAAAATGTQDDKTQKKIQECEEKISSSLSAMKFMLYGDGDGNDPKKENIEKLSELLFTNDVLLLILKHMKKFEFEARKDVAQIYNYVLRQRRQQAIDYVMAHPDILTWLVHGYEDSEIALNCGSILRECIRHQHLCEHILRTPELFNAFFEYVQLSTFDVASDAFATFKMLLTKHKPVCAKFLETNFDDVFARYNVLLESKNYVTKRQSLKLLGELLLDRSNFKTMMKYINSPNNLKIMMNLLRGTTKAIQFEAFHVFKIFVANPNKAKPIVEILTRNKDRLIDFLRKFQTDKEDEQFNEEKRILLAALQKLDPSTLEPVAAPNAAPTPSAPPAAAPAPPTSPSNSTQSQPSIASPNR